jgi:hypothetical protein
VLLAAPGAAYAEGVAPDPGSYGRKDMAAVQGSGVFSCTERCPVRRHAKDGEKYRDKPLTAICPVRVPTGVLGLLLPPLARSPLKSSRLRRWVSPTGHDRLDQIKRAAAADVAVVRENDRLVNPNAPGLQNDEL